MISFRRYPQPLESLEGSRHLRLRTKRLLAFSGILLEVRKWSGTGFSRLQTIQTYDARDVKSFQMNGQIFLAIAN